MSKSSRFYAPYVLYVGPDSLITFFNCGVPGHYDNRVRKNGFLTVVVCMYCQKNVTIRRERSMVQSQKLGSHGGLLPVLLPLPSLEFEVTKSIYALDEGLR